MATVSPDLKKQVLEEMFVKFSNESDYPTAVSFEIEQKRKGRIHAVNELISEGTIRHDSKYLKFLPSSYFESQWGEKDLGMLDNVLPILSEMYENKPDKSHSVGDFLNILKAKDFLFLKPINVERLLRELSWLSLIGGYQETEGEPKRIEAFSIPRLILSCDDIRAHVKKYYPTKLPGVDPANAKGVFLGHSSVKAGGPQTFHSVYSTYKVIKQIGQGGTGRVFQVENEDGDLFALKLLDPEKVTKDRLKRFRNEITFCRMNKHKNIISVVDEGPAQTEKGSSIFYVMPLVRGSLRDEMKAGLKPEEVLPIFSQLLDGVEAAHLQKVVHRDLKPENVLFDRQANKVIVADFGIAQFEEEELFTAVETKNNERLANFQYAAPEQRARGAKVDLHADIFSLGLILNEMFTKVVPVGTGYYTISDVASNLAYLDPIVERMIRQEPSHRLASIDAIKLELSGKGNEFIINQKLSNLQNIVIPTGTVDDSLVANPPRLIGADYSGGNLILKLSQPVNPKWISVLYNMGTYESLLNKEPQRFNIRDDIASIASEEREVQPLIDHFKKWIEIVNRMYPNMLTSELRAEEDRKRKAIAMQIAEEERRQRVLRNIRI